jgi:hypothetical protein
VLQRIRQLSPFGEPAFVEVQEGNSAQVWFWDAARVERLHAQQDLPSLEMIPEALLYPARENGLWVQECLDGCEMQYWVGNSLRHSRWLPEAPTERERLDFTRVCNAPEAESWQHASAQLLVRPRNEKEFWSREYLLGPTVAPKIIMALLLVWLVFETGMWGGASLKEILLTRSVASKNAQLIELVRQRDRALQHQEFNQSILDLLASPTQLHLLAKVQLCLKDVNYVIYDWQYQRGQLSLVLQQQNLDTRALIEACSRESIFSEVRAEPGITPDQTRLLFKLAVSGRKEQGNAQ